MSAKHCFIDLLSVQGFHVGRARVSDSGWCLSYLAVLRCQHGTDGIDEELPKGNPADSHADLRLRRKIIGKFAVVRICRIYFHARVAKGRKAPRRGYLARMAKQLHGVAADYRQIVRAIQFVGDREVWVQRIWSGKLPVIGKSDLAGKGHGTSQPVIQPSCWGRY